MKTVTTIEGDMIDLICRRHYGDETGYAERVYDANPDLAEHGPKLPAGIVVKLPNVAPPETAPAISLWD